LEASTVLTDGAPNELIVSPELLEEYAKHIWLSPPKFQT
jgi:hypothetical protein